MKEVQRYYGKYRGVVIQPVDPQTDGRIVASVTVGGVPLQVVADACMAFGGPGMGLFAVPPTLSGVWIEFLEGDINKPVWSGCWWPEGQLQISLGMAAKLASLPIVMQSMAGNRLVINTVGPDCVVLETVAADLGPRIALSLTGIKLSFGPTVTIELSADGVSICGKALQVLPV
ncbi:phage baseplate assembly protein V [Caballeronia sp. SEWSISQ10-4 2]|uniref:phage baseplate assembly protein V n=1 Tax=Caballeronia sp. SEWSISQ10-4 2 TaxID=2937438 RepID=UPI0026540E34|nr:phage baseplate assembly protein V [Caballeronia sp. SEWSISQ10-4 2]MDN7179629.1 phage baseplate assembly protein V [Caballeronia sp. SEWSISQ10-4 2]